MRSDSWSTAALGSCCVFVRDGDWIETRDQGGGDFRLIQISNLGVGRFIETGTFRWITAQTFARLGCTEIQQGDLLIARMPDPTGRAWLVRNLPWRSITAVDVAIVRVRSDQLNAAFLAYFLNSPRTLALVESLTTGTTRSRIRRADIERLEIPLPPLDEQRRIAGVLGALDDKIEHNLRLSSRLADLARVAFESAVVRWRPRSHPAVLADVAAPSREPADEDAPYIGLDVMPRGSTVLSEWLVGGAPTGQAVRFRRGDILFGKLRPYFKKVGVAPIDGRCSTEILVLRPKLPHLWGLLLGYVSSDAFISYCVQVSRGTKMPRSEWNDASAFAVVVPTDEEAADLTRKMRLFYDMAIELVHENKHLASIRDALLPKLVSGKIRVLDTYDPVDRLGTLAEVAGAGAP